MIRTYPLKHSINLGKQGKIITLAGVYRKLAVKLASLQWKEFYLHSDFNKNLDIKDVKSQLSQRYKQTCQYQVISVLDSFIANRQNEFVRMVWRSGLNDTAKLELFYINKYWLWFASSVTMPVFDDKGNKIEDEVREVSQDTIKLARTIFKHVLKKHRRPRLNRCNLALDAKVARISPRQQTCKKKAKTFDYWIYLSTLEPGKPIYLPLTTNKYFENKRGKQKNFCQINIGEQDQITICLIKDVEKRAYVPKTPKISLDFGLRNLFTTNTGDLYGRDFIETLKKYDTYISSLARNRQRQGFSVKSRAYNNLVEHLRSFLKNEICRVINRIIENYKPKEIAVEDLNFTSVELSRRMNRLLSNMGRKIVQEKLDSISEEFSIVITKVPAPYTSQECHLCGYVDKKNRKTQSTFICLHCNKKLHADVNGARTVLIRSSDKNLRNLNLSKSAILDILIRRFLVCHPDFSDYAPHLKERNPYFRQCRQYGTTGNLNYG